MGKKKSKRGQHFQRYQDFQDTESELKLFLEDFMSKNDPVGLYYGPSSLHAQYRWAPVNLVVHSTHLFLVRRRPVCLSWNRDRWELVPLVCIQNYSFPSAEPK